MESLPEQPGGRGDEVEDDNLTTPLYVPKPEVEDEEAYPPRAAAETGGWTIAILCMGLGIIAACLVIPQADANRRLVYEREKLRLDLTQVQKQIAVNKEIPVGNGKRSATHGAPRAAGNARCSRAKRSWIRSRTRVAQSASADAERMSPFNIINVPPPASLAPYQPVGGYFAQLCRSPQSHVYLLGAGMILVAGGLVLGGTQGPRGASFQPATSEKTDTENTETTEED